MDCSHNDFSCIIQLESLTDLLQWQTGDITPEAKQTWYIMTASTVLIQQPLQQVSCGNTDW